MLVSQEKNQRDIDLYMLHKGELAIFPVDGIKSYARFKANEGLIEMMKKYNVENESQLCSMLFGTGELLK